MVYLDPKSDIAFKRLFGDITHKNLLISFLNNVLDRKGGETIVDLTINDPHNLPLNADDKASAVDVKCTDQNNNQYIVEMQVLSKKNYAARAQYYSSLALSRQLASTESYDKLVPVIFVGILNFTLFNSDDCISKHLILNTQTYEHALKHLEFYFVELDKFTKEIDQLETLLDKWIYFFKNAFKLHSVPDPLSDPLLKEAFHVLEQSNWSDQELDAYNRYLDNIRSLADIREAGYDTGYDKGYDSGIQAGKEAGMQEGALRAKITLAKNLLDILDSATIAQKTGLSLEEVEALKKNL